MHVALDVTSLLYARGVSRYTSNLVRALSLREGLTLSAVGASFRRRGELVKLTQELSPRLAEIVIKPYPLSLLRWLWGRGRQPPGDWLAPSNQPQVFHSWDWLQPPPSAIPTITTLHDLAMLRFPETAHPQILAAHRHSWQTIKKQNLHVLAVSEATRQDAIQLLGLRPDRVHRVYEALPWEIVTTAASLTEAYCLSVRQRLGLKKPFLLFVGVDEPRKNLARALEAWQAFASEFAFVVVGASGWGATDYRRFRHQPHFVGPVSDRLLSALYAEARLLLYPSLYEGFGLPILEAFHHGTPVVTSQSSSMAEIAGNAATLVDPFAIDSIREAIRTVLNEDEAAQDRRRQRMILRLQVFDWSLTAQHTHHLYQLVSREGQR